jgi:hypothetical protein
LRYEIVINTENYQGDTANKEDYVNGLILALTRFGYSPYLSDWGAVCFSTYADDRITEIPDEMTDDIVAKNML